MTTLEHPAAPEPRAAIDRLWKRDLDRYPETGPRVWYLAVVVLATIVLYCEQYVTGGVAPLVLAHFEMSFLFYVNALVVGGLVGAFGALAAGLCDKWGRANLVAYGLGVTGVLTLLVPSMPNKWAFVVLLTVIGMVEGVILVATPALVRDFSPQIGRASAMGFWTLGPVVASLIVSFVANRTLERLDDSWASQYYIMGAFGLVVFAIALAGLRELNPGLRSQVMVSAEDRAKVEARAAQAEASADLGRPWAQMLKFDILAPAAGISIFLIIYYTAVGFFTIYLTTTFGFSTSRANGINTWYWAMDAIALVVVGLVSDRLRVRKPFMAGGTVLAVVMTYVFLTRATHPHTSFGALATIVSLLAVGLAIAYAPWMAAFTETIERRNPALMAHGLAVWGWTTRIAVAGSIFVLQYVVSSANTLVSAPEKLAEAKAAKEAGHAPSAALMQHLADIKQAAADAPHQWQHWWWVCIVAQLLFFALMLPLAGRWSPRAAKADLEAAEAEK
ncbi:MFS transporter [Actinomadura violacea]|uniref:MFS transporter n=1 Tax=Actinomadura violacea TaxID=2819934 RepID=A0ABS3S2F7_9ACTN|nr:MFS transporter [Actinomadura violacea]MBO2463186.1 MFS transporter [Actinomadura violacea]